MNRTNGASNLEKNFNDLLQDRQKTTVMDAHSTFQEGQDGLDLDKRWGKQSCQIFDRE